MAIIRKSLANGGDITGDLFIDGNLSITGPVTSEGDSLFQNIHATGSIEADNGASIHGDLSVDKTITNAGTTGNRTINTISGTVNFAAGATSLTVTNSLVTANSIVFAVLMTNDATAVLKCCTVGSGGFTIRMTAAPTAETKVGFLVIN